MFVQTLGIIAAIIAVLLCFFLGWRWASRQWQLPCPSLLGWALETRLYDRLSGTSATLDRMKLEPGQRILEIGPGPGRLLIPAAKRIQPGGEAVGIDIQPGMVDRLRARAAEAEVTNLTAILGDATKPHIENGSFRSIAVHRKRRHPDRLQRCRPGCRVRFPKVVFELKQYAVWQCSRRSDRCRPRCTALGFRGLYLPFYVAGGTSSVLAHIFISVLLGCLADLARNRAECK